MVGRAMAIMALELQMSDLENLTRHGLTIDSTYSDRQLAIQRAGARCGKTNAAAGMVIELARRIVL